MASNLVLRFFFFFLFIFLQSLIVGPKIKNKKKCQDLCVGSTYIIYTLQHYLDLVFKLLDGFFFFLPFFFGSWFSCEVEGSQSGGRKEGRKEEKQPKEEREDNARNAIDVYHPPSLFRFSQPP